jgi:hypothetical protein
VGDLGKAHRIHAAVNNHQEENQLNVLETSSIIADQTLITLIDLGATKIFISSAMLKRIKVKEVKQDKFSFVEIDSRAKQKVGGKVTGYILNPGEFFIGANLYLTILGSYDIVISMDWLELHEAILIYKTKQLSLIDDEEQRHVIVVRNQGISMSLSLPCSYGRACAMDANYMRSLR